MAVNFPPYYTSQILNADGKPVAGGTIRAYFTGTESPAPLFTSDGTPLGSSVSIDAAGNAVFCLRVGTIYRLRCIDADGAVVWTRDGVRALGETAGIENPMSAAGDMIVGAAGGEPARLAPGAEGDALKIVGGVPTWSTDQTGMANPMTTAGDLIVGGTGGTATALPVGANGEVLTSDGTTASWAAPATQPGDHLVKASATDASDPGSLNDKLAVLSPVVKNTIITPQGDEKLLLGIGTSGVTDGYVLTKGMTGADWAAIPTQPGDHKTAVDGADASPDYLAAKLAAGTGISLTNTGSAVEIAATVQTGDHQLLVSATDAAVGYLGAKLTAGSNITLTPQTDGDGVQTLEIAATGGGGGGGVNTFVKWTQEFVGATGTTSMSTTQSIVLKCYADTDMIPEEVVLPCDHQYANTTYKAFIVVGTETFSSSTVSFSGSVTITTPSTTPPRVAHIPLTGKNGFTKIEEGKTYFLVFGKSSGNTSEYFKQDYGVTLYHARTYAGAITETPNWVWNNATAQTGLPIVGLKFKRA